MLHTLKVYFWPKDWRHTCRYSNGKTSLNRRTVVLTLQSDVFRLNLSSHERIIAMDRIQLKKNWKMLLLLSRCSVGVRAGLYNIMCIKKIYLNRSVLQTNLKMALFLTIKLNYWGSIYSAIIHIRIISTAAIYISALMQTLYAVGVHIHGNVVVRYLCCRIEPSKVNILHLIVPHYSSGAYCTLPRSRIGCDLNEESFE